MTSTHRSRKLLLRLNAPTKQSSSTSVARMCCGSRSTVTKRPTRGGEQDKGNGPREHLLLDHPETLESVIPLLVLAHEFLAKLVAALVVHLDAARLHELDDRRRFHRGLRGVVEHLQRGTRCSLRCREHEPRADPVPEAELLARLRIRKKWMPLR